VTTVAGREAPRYALIANAIRQRIESGVWPAGTLLPSEPALRTEFDVSVGTVRHALDVLRDEGLVHTEMGRGTVVLSQPTMVTHGADRYRAAGGPPRAGETLVRDFREAPAAPNLAELFGVPQSTPLLERRFVRLLHGVPQAVTTSWMVVATATGSELADQTAAPWPERALISWFAAHGIALAEIEETVLVRRAEPAERDALRLARGSDVLSIRRRVLATDGAVVEVATTALPSDRTALAYRIPASQWSE
jgi:GntR family transcriptional regulator